MKVPPRPGEGIVVVISGPSGSGKSTICRRVAKDTGYEVSVSCTTRPPRSGERNGVDYHFVTREEFEQRLAEGGFLEHSAHFGHLYGTPLAPVRDAIERGEVILLEIDVEGARQAMERLTSVFGIFIMPPSTEELTRRLRARRTDDEEAIRQRLDRATKEMERCAGYDRQVTNDDLDAAVQAVKRLIEAEVLRKHG